MEIITKQEKFIQKANIIHQNKYDYSLVQYVRTHDKIIIICSIHGEFLQCPMSHLTGSGCPICSIEKTKQTNLIKYGVSNPLQNKEIQEKITQTNLNRYGVEYPSQNKEIQEKVKQTNLDRYGAVTFMFSAIGQEKIKKNIFERYGVEYSGQIPEKIEKTKQTWLTNYGCHPKQTIEVQEKTKQTNLEKYGAENPQQNKEIQEKQNKPI